MISNFFTRLFNSFQILLILIKNRKETASKISWPLMCYTNTCLFL